MIVSQAKEIARQWVHEEAARKPGFRGALFHGSANWLPGEAELPATSDLDVLVVLAEPDHNLTLGKFSFRGVLLDVSALPNDQLRSPELILANYRLAGSFRAASVIADPSGRLSAPQTAVARDYAKRRWVRARRDDALENALSHLRSADEAGPFADRVTGWLFGTGVTTHVLLAAGLRNPTVRTRYLAARALLADYGRLDFYEALLELLGCAQMSRARAELHLAALAEAFDAAKSVIRTPFFFAADISDLARPVAIDGSRDLIERGFQREAVFWLLATYARCEKVLHHDAPPELWARFEPGFRSLLADLGIASPADLQERAAQVRAFLAQVREVSDEIMAANPTIEDEPRA